MKKTLLSFVSLCVFVFVFCFSASARDYYSFNTVDGKTAPLYSEEYDLTVTVFGKPDCTNTQKTIYNILSAGIDKKEKIKVNFVDVENNSKETVLEFRNSELIKDFPQNNISFCYCDDNIANFHMWNSFRPYDATSTQLTYPGIAYYTNDGRNMNFTTGLQSAEDITKIITYKYDLYQEVTFEISGTENYDYASEVLEQLNELRASKGLSKLGTDEALTEAAMQRAAELSVYYSHRRPDGKLGFGALPPEINDDKTGALGENIAVGQISPAAVMKDWTNSQGHYRNMLSDSFRSVGIGAFEASDGTMYWVQFFYGGKRDITETTGSKEVSRKITADLKHLDLSVRLPYGVSSALLEKGDNTELEIINTNCGWSYITQALSFSDFQIKSENENLLYIDENGVATVKGEPPFDVNIKITNKSNPAFYFNTKLTIGHRHEYSVHTSKYELCCGYSETSKTYSCYFCDYSYKETESSGSHDFTETVLYAATISKDGKYGMRCVCGETKDIKPIPQITDITVSETEYTYNGKNKNPTLTIKDKNGYVLKEDTDYIVNGMKNLKFAEIHNVTVYFRNKYSGYHNFEIKIYPAAPSGLTLKSTSKAVSAKWKAAKGAAEYKAELIKGGKVVQTVIATDTTANFEKLSKNTKYSVRVTALSAVDSLSSLKSISAETATVSAPTLKVKAQKKKAALSWKKVTRANGYVIYMATSKNGKYKKVATLKNGSTLKYTKKKLKTNKKYYFKIKAYRTINKKNIYSNYSSVKSVKIK